MRLYCVTVVSVIANKTALRLSDHCPMCLFVTSTLATQFTAHPTVQVTFLQTKCTTVVKVGSFPYSCHLYFGVSDFIECNMKFFWHWYRPQTDIFEMSNVSWSENLGKYFSLQVAPQGYVSSVQVLHYIF